MPNNTGIFMIYSSDKPSSFRLSTCLAALFLTASLGACTDGVEVDRTYPDKNDTGDGSELGTVLGGGGLTLFSNENSSPDKPDLKPERHSAADVRVNSFLWRATLDTLSFLPMQSTDARGGVIVTDWYSTREAPNERIKVTVYILASNLRADALTVASFKQVLIDGNWISLSQNEAVNRRLEDAILVKARELRISEPSE